MRIGHLLRAHSIPLLVLFRLEMHLHHIVTNEIPCARHTVVLCQSRLILVMRLIQQLLGDLWLHISEDDLVDVPRRSRILGAPCLTILFIACGVSTTALLSGAHDGCD